MTTKKGTQEMAREPDGEIMKNWLKAKGHNAAKVDGKQWNNRGQRIQSMRELHGVSGGEYQRAKRLGG